MARADGNGLIFGQKVANPRLAETSVGKPRAPVGADEEKNGGRGGCGLLRAAGYSVALGHVALTIVSDDTVNVLQLLSIPVRSIPVRGVWSGLAGSLGRVAGAAECSIAGLTLPVTRTLWFRCAARFTPDSATRMYLLGHHAGRRLGHRVRRRLGLRAGTGGLVFDVGEDVLGDGTRRTGSRRRRRRAARGCLPGLQASSGGDRSVVGGRRCRRRPRRRLRTRLRRCLCCHGQTASDDESAAGREDRVRHDCCSSCSDESPCATVGSAESGARFRPRTPRYPRRLHATWAVVAPVEGVGPRRPLVGGSGPTLGRPDGWSGVPSDGAVRIKQPIRGWQSACTAPRRIIPEHRFT